MTAKALIAIAVLVGAFALMALSMLESGHGVPDTIVVAFTGPIIGAVVAFYFGAHNGAADAQIEAVTRAIDVAQRASSRADTILALAQQRRHGDIGNGNAPTSPPAEDAAA